jgi:hypothetical protein
MCILGIHKCLAAPDRSSPLVEKPAPCYVPFMARPQGGRFNRRDSTVLSVRLPKALADDVYTAAGSRKGSALAEWLRLAVMQALRGGSPLGRGAATAAGYEEGKRQGWAHANAIFRDALGRAAEALKK